MLRMYAYLSPMGWPCIYSICFLSWMVNRIFFPLDWYYLPLLVLVKDIERAVYLG